MEIIQADVQNTLNSFQPHAEQIVMEYADQRARNIALYTYTAVLLLPFFLSSLIIGVSVLQVFLAVFVPIGIVCSLLFHEYDRSIWRKPKTLPKKFEPFFYIHSTTEQGMVTLSIWAHTKSYSGSDTKVRSQTIALEDEDLAHETIVDWTEEIRLANLEFVEKANRMLKAKRQLLLEEQLQRTQAFQQLQDQQAAEAATQKRIEKSIKHFAEK